VNSTLEFPEPLRDQSPDGSMNGGHPPQTAGPVGADLGRAACGDLYKTATVYKTLTDNLSVPPEKRGRGAAHTYTYTHFSQLNNVYMCERKKASYPLKDPSLSLQTPPRPTRSKPRPQGLSRVPRATG